MKDDGLITELRNAFYDNGIAPITDTEAWSNGQFGDLLANVTNKKPEVI